MRSALELVPRGFADQPRDSAQALQAGVMVANEMAVLAPVHRDLDGLGTMGQGLPVGMQRMLGPIIPRPAVGNVEEILPEQVCRADRLESGYPLPVAVPRRPSAGDLERIGLLCIALLGLCLGRLPPGAVLTVMACSWPCTKSVYRGCQPSSVRSTVESMA